MSRPNRPAFWLKAARPRASVYPGTAASGFGAGLRIGLETALESDFGATDGVDFNGFDAGMWDSFAKALLAALPDVSATFLATALRALVTGALTEAFEPLRAVFAVIAFGADFFADFLASFLAGAFANVLEDPLGDFLRVFLDIRLPFVAFGGSTNRVLRVSSRPTGFAPAAGQV